MHEAVIAAGEQVSGCTIHLVTENYDEGPVLDHMEVPVKEGDTAEIWRAGCSKPNANCCPAPWLPWPMVRSASPMPLEGYDKSMAKPAGMKSRFVRGIAAASDPPHHLGGLHRLEIHLRHHCRSHQRFDP